MRKLALVAAAGAAVVALAGCSQIATLKPVAGDSISSVRTATIDVALANGIAFQSAPVCPIPDGTHFTCEGKATDGRAVTSEADQVTVAEVPEQYKSQIPPDAAETDPQIVIKINAGGATLYEGLVITVMDQNARTQ